MENNILPIANTNRNAVLPLRKIACNYLQPPWPCLENWFAVTSKALWSSFNSEMEESHTVSSKISLNTTITEVRGKFWKYEPDFAICSPSCCILMKESAFLNHCDAVKSGSKRENPIKSCHVLRHDTDDQQFLKNKAIETVSQKDNIEQKTQIRTEMRSQLNSFDKTDKETQDYKKNVCNLIKHCKNSVLTYPS